MTVDVTNMAAAQGFNGKRAMGMHLEYCEERIGVYKGWWGDILWECFFMMEAIPEIMQFVYGWGTVVAAGGPGDGDVGLDEE